MKIKADILHEVNTPFSVETLDLEVSHEGEALVNVAATAVWSCFNQASPGIPL